MKLLNCIQFDLLISAKKIHCLFGSSKEFCEQCFSLEIRRIQILIKLLLSKECFETRI
jgi:hypothetical protein